MVQEGAPLVAPADATPWQKDVSVVGAGDAVGARRPAKAREAAAARDRRLRLLTWRNAGFGFVGALAVWGVVAAGWLLMGGRIERPVEPTAIDPAHRIAVLPFSYRGDEEYAYLGEGMVDLLSYSLDGVGEVRTVTPRAVFSVLRQYGDSTADPDRDAAVTQRLEAARYVEGEIVESGSHLRISARLVRVDADPGVVIAAVVDGEIEDGITDLLDALSAQLLVGSEAGQLSQLGRVASMTTDSLAALKAFLEGWRSYRVFEREQAIEALRRAVEIDSTFALAWWQLAEAYRIGGTAPELSVEAAGQAVRWSGHLPWRERQLILAFDAYLRGEFHAADRCYRAVTRRYPENVSAWLGLNHVSYYAELHGRRWTEAFESSRQAYLQSATYEPDLLRGPAVAYWWQAVLAGDSALADSLLPKWTSRDSMPSNARVFEAFCIGDRAAQDSIVARAIASGSGSGMLAIVHAGTCGTGIWRGAETARAVARRAESGRVRAWAHLHAAAYELALGHRGAARAELEGVRAIEPTWASQHEAYWLLPAAFGAQRSDLEAARNSLLARDAPIVSPLRAPAGGFARWVTTVNDSIQPHIQLYLLGRLSARLGDYDAALRYADEVEALKAPFLHASVSRDKAQAIRAFVLREEGRYREALAALEAAPRLVGFWIIDSPFTGEAQERYLRAELLADLGRNDEALRWLDGVGDWYHSAPMRAPARLLSAQIYERLGDVENAAIQYKRFIDLWKDCDPELRHWVDAARRALEALSPDT
jgi:tetratricopeptide (TPR) repeat protein